VVGFALEDENIKAGAEKKLKEKGLDMIIANKFSAIGEDYSSLLIKTTHTLAFASLRVSRRESRRQARKRGGWQILPRGPKKLTAEKIIRLIERLSQNVSRSS
jgi:hypothetical protein